MGTFQRVSLSFVHNGIDKIGTSQPEIVPPAQGLVVHLLGFRQGTVGVSDIDVFLTQPDPSLVIPEPILMFATKIHQGIRHDEERVVLVIVIVVKNKRIQFPLHILP